MTKNQTKPHPIYFNKSGQVLQVTPIAIASLLCLLGQGTNAWAQAALERQGAAIDAPTVTITGSPSTSAETLTGFGDMPLRDIPLSVTVLTSKDLANKGLLRLSDLTKLDPSTTESYNAVGYWDFLEVRGFVLDNRYNFRREGLPISAETSVPLDNKERIEILKGTSGMQAGTSAPGGLVNYTVKRPTNQDLRTAKFELTPRGGSLVGLDVGGRIGESKSWGYRVNVVHEALRPELGNANGQRDLFSLALDQRISADLLLEAEIEVSKRSQPSQAAFSLLDRTLPPVRANLNLNNQAWSQPVVMGATTSTLRLTQALGANWSLNAQLGMQQLRTDDRIAYPSGCAASYGPTFCSDGTFDLYDYRSEGEKRQLNSGKLSLRGRMQWAGWVHNLTAEHLRSHSQERYNLQAYNSTGIGNIAGTSITTADPSLTNSPTNRSERSSEWMLTDSVVWNNWRGFAGLRFTQLQRSSVGVDASSPTAYTQNITTPWMGLSYALGASQLYLSSGQGVESYVTPNKSSYTFAGQALSAAKSHQFETGIRTGNKITSGSLAWFDISRPAIADDGTNFRIDGLARHRGIEGQIQHQMGALKLAASAMLLDAKRQSSVDAAYNGLKPTNVPNSTMRFQSDYRINGTGWNLQNTVVRDGERAITPDNTVTLPAWWRWDVALGHASSIAGKTITARLSIDNVTNRSYWKGSPTQYGNYFLYPGAPRTLRLSAALDF